MDQLNFIVSWPTGKKPEVLLVEEDRGLAIARFEALMSDSKIENLKLYSQVSPTRRATPAETAKIVAENNKRLKEAEEAKANAEKIKAEAAVASAEEALKAAKAKAKELGLK